MIKVSTAEKVVFSFLLFISALLIVRIMYANNLRYVFLLWNLFLAWIPFQLGIVITQKVLYPQWARNGLVVCWLLFFPNALYIVTDLIHLKNSTDLVPVWFDAVLLFASSFTGLLMAFISLFMVEVYMRTHISAQHTGKLVAACIFLGSFGVYIGRFLRWNSWDIVANPVSLLVQVGARISSPMLHHRTWMITLLLTCFFGLLYFGVKKLAAAFSTEREW